MRNGKNKNLHQNNSKPYERKRAQVLRKTNLVIKQQNSDVSRRDEMS